MMVLADLMITLFSWSMCLGKRFDFYLEKNPICQSFSTVLGENLIVAAKLANFVLCVLILFHYVIWDEKIPRLPNQIWMISDMEYTLRLNGRQIWRNRQKYWWMLMKKVNLGGEANKDIRVEYNGWSAYNRRTITKRRQDRT